MYKIKNEDLVINALIQINQVTGKRIISNNDIENYKKILIISARNNKISISFEDEEISDNSLIKIIDNNYYIMQPNIDIDNLISYNEKNSDKLIFFINNLEIKFALTKKYNYSKKYKEIFKKIYTIILEEHLNYYHELEEKMNEEKNYIDKIKNNLGKSSPSENELIRLSVIDRITIIKKFKEFLLENEIDSKKLEEFKQNNCSLCGSLACSSIVDENSVGCFKLASYVMKNKDSICKIKK